MKSKDSPMFVCDNCGSSFASWFGKCPDCSEWNTLKQLSLKTQSKGETLSPARFEALSGQQKSQSEDNRVSTGLPELDRVLGGGLIPDEVVLLAGEPGVGKSTLLMTVLSKLVIDSKHKVVYVSSEEAGHQIESRCRRLNINTENILFSSDKEIGGLLSGLAKIIEIQPVRLVVFDSLQGLYAEGSSGLPGSMSQSKEVLMAIVEFCKKQKVVGLVIGHITKEGEIAGPKFLEHMVDCVLFLEGEKNSNLRLLRAFKNRFGPVDEVGFFAMQNQGMIEVKNPSEFFLEWADKAVGKASIAVRQGARVVFATVESLVVSSNLPFPKRVAKGIDQKRLELLLAILKKYLKLNVDKYDIYVNISGGLKVEDRVADLGLLVALYSSLTGQTFDPKHLFLGEVGLLGNIRPSHALALINKEAKRLGFAKIYSAKTLSRVQQLKSL